MKTCIICKETKHLDAFYKKTGRVDQYISYCKDCWKIKRHNLYIKHRNKSYSSGARIPCSSRKIFLDRKLFSSEREWRATYQNLYNKQRSKTDINFKLLSRIRTRLNKALAGNYKIGSTIDNLGCSIEELKKHLEKTFRPNPKTGEVMSWNNHGSWHIDHIKPLSKFDLTDPEQQRKACHYSNLQPLWAEENLSKGDK